MSIVRSLGILQIPSHNEDGWRMAIAQAASARSWSMTKTTGAEPVVIDADLPIVVFVRSADDLLDLELDSWVVLNVPIPEAETAAAQRKGSSGNDAIRHVATRLAAASVLASRGALVLDASGNRLDLPGLGLIELPDHRPVTSVAAMPSPLAVYQHLPPLAGDKAVWPAETFSFTVGQAADGGTPEIELTGRTRILVHGPYLDLPPGWWRITVRLIVEPEDVAYLMFDWAVGTDSVTAHADFSVAGTYEVVLDRHWLSPGAAELRIWAERGHFLGRMTLLDCEVERLPDFEEPAVALA